MTPALPRLIILAVLVLEASADDASAGWKLGRATYYAAPEQIVKAYDPSRGEGSFGILAYGACGYTNLPKGDLPFAREQYAASADASPDYPGSCGRCYEIKCQSGPVLSNDMQPLRLVYPNGSKIAYFDGDYARPYLASINATVKDDLGRSYPGNPTESQSLMSTSCWNSSNSIRIRIADQCPCKQVLSEGAPGVKPGGEVRRQEWCCGPVQHFDISYWAFQQLAHPVSGAMMLEYRAVDCDTGAVIPSTFISSTIYSEAGGIKPGWGWYPYSSSIAQLLVPGTGPSGGLSTCVRVAFKDAPTGGLSFRSREADRPGFQPFKDKTRLEFAIRSNSNTKDTNQTSTPQGEIPGLKLFVMEDPGKYCSAELVLGKTTQPTRKQSDWSFFSVPLSDFKCGSSGSATQDKLNRFDFQNMGDRDAEFCLTDIKLV